MALERVPADIRRDGRRRAHVGSADDPRDPGGRVDPGDGEVPHRPLRRGADPRGARGRLHRRVRGADSRRRRAPRRQVRVHRPVRLRRDEPRRGAAPDRRGRGDDPDEGRGRNRRHRQRGHAHALRVRRRSGGCRACARRSSTPRRRSYRAPYELVRWVAENGRLPVVTFTAGGIATPADAALCMQLGADGVFVGSGIFKSGRDSSSTATAGRRTSPGARRRSSRRPRTTPTRRSSPTSRPGSARRWSASPRARSPRRERLEVRGW